MKYFTMEAVFLISIFAQYSTLSPMWSVFYPEIFSITSDFTGHETQMSTEADKIMVTDMGIATNLPFPAALRPERGIEMFLVFDWSLKKCDSEHPFRVRDSLVCTMSCNGPCI